MILKNVSVSINGLGMTFLAIDRGPESGKRIEIGSFPIILGRDPQSSIVIKDPEISRKHVRLKKRGSLFIVEDLGSRNGTFVNGDRVVNTTIHNGDKILIGGSELSFYTADDNVHIQTDFLGFDAIIDEKAGLKGPIGVDHRGQMHNLKHATRIDPASLSNKVMTSQKAVKEVFNFHSNLMVVKDLNETSLTLLKSIGKIASSAARAAIFVWSERSRSLLPYAQKYFTEIRPFKLSQKAFEDAISRKQVIIISSPKSSETKQTRVILPMLHSDSIVALVHIEFDFIRKDEIIRSMETVQALLNRASPIIESLLLRKEIDSWLIGIMDTIISTVEAKDTYTRGHSERVSNYCMAIADELKLNKEVRKLLMISSLCHDIGKVGIPDAILKKAALLSAEEYAEMQLHPVIGADIISHLPNAQRIISGVKYHHEKWDGTGYPDGLVGEDIPFFGRIVALADVFDAMVSGRSYSGFIDENDALTRLHEEAELFDPEILKAFTRAFEKGTITPKTMTQSNSPKEFQGNNDDSEIIQSPTIITTIK